MGSAGPSSENVATISEGTGCPLSSCPAQRKNIKQFRKKSNLETYRRCNMVSVEKFLLLMPSSWLELRAPRAVLLRRELLFLLILLKGITSNIQMRKPLFLEFLLTKILC